MSLEVAAFYQCSAQEGMSEIHPFFFNLAHIFLKYMQLLTLRYKVCSINDISVRGEHVGALWLIEVSNNTTYDLNVFSCG